jgi:membrane protein YdbS with pleckstrin-like domain
MTYGPTYNRYGGMSRIVGVLLVIWLIIGAIAAGQRGYYSSAKSNCASVATIAVTVLAGPLNYAGVNPKAGCPQPSK